MLTKREEQVLALHAAGFTPEEIGDMLGNEANTVRKIIDNIKKKTNWHKATELVGLFLCHFMGADYQEIRKQIISGVMLAIFVVSMACINDSYTTRNSSRSSQRCRVSVRRSELDFNELLDLAI